MKVEAGRVWNVDDSLRKQLSVGHDHEKVRVEPGENVRFADDLFWLQHGNTILFCDELDGRGREGLLSAEGSIGLGH